MVPFLVSAALAGATASNFKSENKKGANLWNAQSAIDGKMETCWMVPGESANRGEWIELSIPKSEVDKIGIMPGWAKDADTFQDYARVKEVKVEVFGYDDNQEIKAVGSANATFADKMEWQVIDLTDMKIGEDLFDGKVKVSVVDIYKGRDFPNIGVSEVLIYLKEFDASPEVRAASSELADHGKDLVKDGNPKTFWAPDGAGPASITFELPGYALSSVGLAPGPKDYGRPKKVEITANERTVTRDLPDSPTAPVFIEIPPVVGYTGSAWGEIEVKILETWPGTKFPQIAVSELKARATSYEGI